MHPRLAEDKTAKNRVHLDVRVAAGRSVSQEAREQWIRTKVAELVAAGATAVREEAYGELSHIVMRDPEGNEFCVACSRTSGSRSHVSVRAKPSRPRPTRPGEN